MTDCSVSIAPFTHLAGKYPDDVAIVWIDAHPDVGTGASSYPGFHAMAVSILTGNGDLDATKLLPRTISHRHVALAGTHAWTEDDYPHMQDWGLQVFAPDSLRSTTAPLVDWLRSTGCGRVAIHFDVDSVDGTEARLGLEGIPGGLTLGEVGRICRDLACASEIVALTISEFIPRDLMRLADTVAHLPLISNPSADHSAAISWPAHPGHMK